ncbi:MAG: Lrp/AsnC family transcriptional regulator [Kofleriaceae bacterium]|nr:Lrp/AsnC family transcriptional regulator [Kofleriaceae bacterium]
MASQQNRMRNEPGPRPLDRIDRALVAALQEDVRRSNKELAARVGLSPSACLERVRRLHRERVIRGAWAEIEPRALGIGLEAMIAVRLAQHARAGVESFRAHVLGLREVVAVHHVAGQVDFLVQVAVRDAGHLRDLALDAFTSRPEVARLETSIIYQSTWSPRLPDFLDPPPAAAPSTRALAPRRGGPRRHRR